MRSWLRAVIQPPDGDPAPATYVMQRLAAGVAALLRVAIGTLGGAAALLGLAPPATARWVIPCVVGNLLWSVIFARFTIRYALSTALTCVDILGTTLLCLVQVHVTAQDALPAGASWVEVTATMTIVICQFTWRWPAATAGGLVVVAGYVLGACRADLPDHGLLQAAIFGIQIISSALLMWLIRRAASAADSALTLRGRQQAQAGAEAARRRTEREHNRQLHDTVLATLTVVGTGAIAASTGTLRRRALDDLALIEALDRPPRIPAPRRPGSTSPAVPLHERLTEVRAGTPDLAVELHLVDCAVPAAVAEAFAGATRQALDNVLDHAGTGTAQVDLASHAGTVEVTVSDTGRGFDPERVPPTRYGIREAIVGRMRAVGGSAQVESRPGGGTTVTLRWAQPRTPEQRHG